MIYKIDFNCDMDRFMHFFKRTYTQSTGRGGYRSKHDDGLLPLNEVTGDMIKLCDKTIQKEKASVTQADWDKMWEGKNRFEIMEAVWKKWIVEEKADAKYMENGEFSAQKWNDVFKVNHWYYIGKLLYIKEN